MDSPLNKKILYVITKSNWGGAQRYVYDLATSLPKEQFDVAVALGGAGELVQKLQQAGISVILLQNIQRDLSLSADASGFLSLYRTIRSYRPDVIHLNSSKAGGLGALAARLLSVPRIVFTAHGWPFAEKRNFAWRELAWLGSWATALLSHEVIVVSKNDLAVGRRMLFCASKMHLIYNGITLPMEFVSGEKIRNAFPQGARITGTIGEMIKNKNQITLIEQAKNNPDMYVAIVGGEGEERPRLEAKIKEYGLENRVKLFGFVPARDVLKGFDVFALPSLKEGLPYVLLEARAAGLPIEANRVGGVGEILDAKDMSDFSLEQMVQKTAALY
jgi:glycosyltransferase involved in cell wall biosynthesis